LPKAKVYIIGAGPGDWELISVKGLRRLREADVVVYDFLASQALLKFVKKDAQIICAGKADGLHLLEQRQINELLYEKAKPGRIVVRLKGGDPFVFSRGVEEALYLKKKKIDFEVIPGITSALAAPESLGIPLSRKGRYSSLAILTGKKSNSQSIDAPKADTLVYVMGVGNIKNIIKAVRKSGRPGSTPCAFIERATTDDERIIAGNLENIIDRARRHALRAPAVFIVGEIINYGRKIYGHKYQKK